MLLSRQEKIDHVVNLFQCPCCQEELPSTDIYSCVANGHAICSSCLLRLSVHYDNPKCPLCRSPGFARSPLATKIMRQLTADKIVTCTYRPCGHKMPWAELRDHERTCEFRPIPCIAGSLGLCRAVVEARQLTNHLFEGHCGNVRMTKTPFPWEFRGEMVLLSPDHEPLGAPARPELLFSHSGPSPRLFVTLQAHRMDESSSRSWAFVFQSFLPDEARAKVLLTLQFYCPAKVGSVTCIDYEAPTLTYMWKPSGFHDKLETMISKGQYLRCDANNLAPLATDGGICHYRVTMQMLTASQNGTLIAPACPLAGTVSNIE